MAVNEQGTSPADWLLALLTECLAAEASDLHLAVGVVPHCRVHGVLAPVPGAIPSDPATMTALVSHLTGRDAGTTALLPWSVDGALTGPSGVRFRYNAYLRQGSWAVAIRRLEDRFRSLSELGIPESLYDLCDLIDGLVLVAGPTGAGKSTTLAALIHHINATRQCHILTIEDPVEYLHNNLHSLVSQRQVGLDCEDFHGALMAALRQDPDVILVGELRDLPTIRTAITAAETGHLVFASVHAGDCVGTVERLVAAYPATEQEGARRQLALVLRAIVAQHLVPADGPAAMNREIALNNDSAPEVPQRRPRVVTSEILRVTPAVANLIAKARTSQLQSALETGVAHGMQTLEQDLCRLVVAGTLTSMSAVAMARHPRVLQERLASAGHDGGTSGLSQRGSQPYRSPNGRGH